MGTLTQLRRMRLDKAARYRNYMFTILNGIKRVTEQCEAAGAAASLAINSRDYFANHRRYHLWKNLLTAYARKGDHREDAKLFLLFMKNLKGGQPLTVTPMALLRQTHQTEVQDLDQATESLDENETPQRHEVARLIRYFVYHGHLPHNLESKG
ncbi:MAG: hypothetical protein K9N55_05825 [Phycisphaerae bacterium]|nr:hypothetical protein [Phycisphaerae bacterium]